MQQYIIICKLYHKKHIQKHTVKLIFEPILRRGKICKLSLHVQYMYMYMPLTLYGCQFWQACNTLHFSTIKFITVLTHARCQEKMRRDGKSLACKASMTQVHHYRYNKQQILDHSLFLKISFNNTYISTEPLLLPLIKEVGSVSKNSYNWF